MIHHPDDVILREGTREHPRQTFPQGVLSVLRLRKDGVPPMAQGREHVRNFRDIRAGTFFTLEYMAPVSAARASCPSGVLM